MPAFLPSLSLDNDGRAVSQLGPPAGRRFPFDLPLNFSELQHVFRTEASLAVLYVSGPFRQCRPHGRG